MSEEDNEVIRKHNGHTEHKHNKYDYWHPVHRIHKENNEHLYPDVKIENELKDAKKEYDRLLSILAKTVVKKYKIQGYSTGYVIGISGVHVVFQRVGLHEAKLYHIEFDEIVGE